MVRREILLGFLVLLPAFTAEPVFTVSEWFGVEYKQEPVSFDVDLAPARPLSAIGLDHGPCQVEILAGTSEAVSRARLWTQVDFPLIEKEITGKDGKPKILREAAPPEQRFKTFSLTNVASKENARCKITPAKSTELELAWIDNGTIRVLIPVKGKVFAEPQSAFALPGPVAAIASGKTEVGSGTLDARERISAVEVAVVNGPIFFQSTVTYRFVHGKSYTSRIRLYAGKPYVMLDEDFDVGGDARFIFNYGDFPVDGYFSTGDFRPYGWSSITDRNGSGEFVTLPGQICQSRLVVWSQFGYFGGKQETIALKGPDPEALAQQRQQEAEQYPKTLAAWEAKKDNKSPKPTPPDTTAWAKVEHVVSSATLSTSLPLTPAGNALAVGAFYVRPDRWTRAKLNHVDVWLRPELPGETSSRSVVGLSKAILRPAMEAWIIAGHREWAIFAVPAADKVFLSKAHIREGVWTLDRLNRLPLVWNSDGTPVAPADKAPRFPPFTSPHPAAAVMNDLSGRCGLQVFNGSGWPRSVSCDPKGWDGTVKPIRAADGNQADMVGTAIIAYMASDDSAYPSRRAMLPWTDPEALNPFYQGMENMNFNVDLYRAVAHFGFRLAAMGHPDARKFLDHAVMSLDMGLSRYVYPQSGCWEESHGYAGHTVKTLKPLVKALKASGIKDFTSDPRFARMAAFASQTLSPPDPQFSGKRIVPPIGDHGMSKDGPTARFADLPDLFAGCSDLESQKLLGQCAWFVAEEQGKTSATASIVEPSFISTWLQGYGAVLRSRSATTGTLFHESMAILRAGQSWGHHHMDKNSLWFWARNLHWFGDCSWGGPPGGTYGNPYKQGPNSGTQLEFHGINNWPLPCKYPGAFIADQVATPEVDYALGRALYPYNPDPAEARPGDPIDPTPSERPLVGAQGYDRQVVFIHPDVLLVRDNIDSAVPVTWRLHAYQATEAKGDQALLTSPLGPVAHLNILHPKSASLAATDRYPTKCPWKGEKNPYAGLSFGTTMLEWLVPEKQSVTWTFTVQDATTAKPVSQNLDQNGLVTHLTLGDKREIMIFCSNRPFQFQGQGWTFEGQVGVAIRQDGKWRCIPIRCEKLIAP